MSGHPAHPPHSHCQNCGTELQGPFCHRCGQQDFDFHRSFGHVFLEALENFFHFDEKFFHNVGTLILRPGRLSADFNAGKRASQMPPFRLYLFISVLFFLIRFLSTGGEPPESARVVAGARQRAELAQSIEQLAAATKDPAAHARLLATAQRLRDPDLKLVELSDAELRDLPAAIVQQVDRARAAPGPGRNFEPSVTLTDRKPSNAFERLMAEKGALAIQHRDEISHAFAHAVPKMLLVCVPLFALFTRLLFWKSGQVYLQHLIIALHYHTFVFLWWPVSDGWQGLTGAVWSVLGGIVAFAAGVWMFLYPFVMLRRLFGQSWLATILKTGVLAAAYLLTLSAGFLATALIVVLTT